MAGRIFKNGWNPIRYPINYYMLAGQKSPAISVIQGLGQPRRIVELMAPGMGGATCVYYGWKPTHFSAITTLNTEKEWKDWATFKTLLKLPARGQRAKALDFWHPFAELYDPPVRSVIIEDVGQPQTQENGSETIEVKFAQFTKPRLSYAKPDGSKDQPADAMEQAIADETAESKQLQDYVESMRK